MTKFKRITLIGMTAMAAVAAPLVTVVSCGSSDESVDETIYIQAEKAWAPLYNEIISDFKKDNGELMKEKGIKDIKIIEMGFTEAEQAFANKGPRDKTTPDVFLVVGDKLQWYKSNKYLKSFNEKSANDFLTKYTKDTKGFVGNADVTIKALEDGGKLWGVPENVEAMVKMYKKGANSDALKVITRFSDLWMTAGFFNTPDFNLRDIVWTDVNAQGKIKTALDGDGDKYDSIDSKKEATDGILKGFTNVLTKIKAAQTIGSSKLDIDAFNIDSSKAAPKVNEFFKHNLDKVSVLAGPWDYPTYSKTITGGVDATSIKAADKWNQWGGGYSYGMNVRMNDSKRDVSEKLISYFYKDKYAKRLFDDCGKVTPTVSGRETLKKDAPNNTIPEAIYDTKVMPKPVDAAFASVNIWQVYANIIGKHKNELGAGTYDISTTAQKLTDEFISAVKAAVGNTNKSNGL